MLIRFKEDGQACRGGCPLGDTEITSGAGEFLAQNTEKKGFDMSKKRLKTLADVRRYLASLVNRVESGDMDEGKAGKLAYISNILISCIKDSDLEERILKLEESMKGGGERWPK